MTTTTTTDTDTADDHTELEADSRLAYVLAGNATVTLESSSTGARFTYQVQAPSERTERGGKRRDTDAPIRFVRLLTGPNNCTDFGYIGFVKRDELGAWHFVHGRGKAVAGAKAPSVLAFAWFARNASDPRVHVHHAGSCGRCGRLLTVPSSLATGLGPVCANAA